WSNVPSIVGYIGRDDTASPTGVDPRTILVPRTDEIDVRANQDQTYLNDPNAAGGVAEVDGIANPTITLNGSGTADSPFILISLTTTGVTTGVRVKYNLRDLDSTGDNSVQQYALQYRIGTSGNFTNVAAAYVADATTGPNLATLV